MNKKEMRQAQIVDLLEIKKEVKVDEIASSFNMTEATIRRDLEILEKDGYLIRTHGGARNLEGETNTAKSFYDRKQYNLEEKLEIVRQVERIIPDDSILTLDNGTTAWLLAKHLKNKKGLKVITNSVLIMEELYDAKNIELLVTGGTFRKRNFDFTGDKTIEFLRSLYSDIAILTCDSYRPSLGFYKLSESSSEIAKAAMDSAKKVFVLADHTKVDADGPFKFSDPEAVDAFFTDTSTLANHKMRLKEEKCDIYYC